jgi:hypothetical protein
VRWCFSSFSDSFIEGVGGNRQLQRRWLNAAGLAVPAAPAGEGDAGACRQLFFQYVVFITTLFLSVLFGMHFGRVSGVAFTFASWVVRHYRELIRKPSGLIGWQRGSIMTPKLPAARASRDKYAFFEDLGLHAPSPERAHPFVEKTVQGDAIYDLGPCGDPRHGTTNRH